MKRPLISGTRLLRVSTLLLVVFAVAGVYLNSGEPASMQPEECHHAAAGDPMAPAAARFAMTAPESPAAITVYSGTLTGAQEVPPVVSAGTGTVTVTVDNVLNTMRVQATFSGLTGTTSAAHIHCCQPLGTNAGVATTTPSFVGFPLGVTSGTMDQTYDMTLASSYNAAFVTANGGTVAGARTALFNGINATQAYFNVHSSFAGGGEIRAQLLPPLAAGVSISGRVTTLEGRGVRNARVSMTDQLGETRVVLTGPRGEFEFTDVPTGTTYVVAVNSRRFSFEPQVISVNDSISGLDFTPSGGGAAER